MADKPASEKTEQATPERLRKAREKGQVAQSQEVPSAIITGGVLVILALNGPAMLGWFRKMLAEALLTPTATTDSQGVFCDFLRTRGMESLVIIMPFLIICGVLSMASSVAISGLTFSPKVLKIDWSKVNPIKGFKNIISAKAVVRLIMSLLKMSVLGTICYLYIQDETLAIVHLRWASPAQAIVGIAGLILGLMTRVVVALFVIGGIDYVYQKWTHSKDMRMTRQEVKEERKQYEGSPEIKRKVRMIQMAMTSKRMLQAVPSADVVITNPTHFAVALQYDRKTMASPIVLAKGPDLLAQRIKGIAREHGVPIVERPALARSLYAAVEVGQPIPSNLFVAVAEVLAMIVRLRKKRKSKRVNRT